MHKIMKHLQIRIKESFRSIHLSLKILPNKSEIRVKSAKKIRWKKKLK